MAPTETVPEAALTRLRLFLFELRALRAQLIAEGEARPEDRLDRLRVADRLDRIIARFVLGADHAEETDR